MKTKENIHLEKNAAFFLPTSSVEDAEKALSGRVKSQPIPRGLEQGAAEGKTKAKSQARDDNKSKQRLNSGGFQRSLMEQTIETIPLPQGNNNCAYCNMTTHRIITSRKMLHF